MLAALALLLHLVAPAGPNEPLPASARALVESAHTERSRACVDVELAAPVP